MDPTQQFWLEVLKIVGPIAAAVVAYLTLRRTQEVAAEVKETKTDMKELKVVVDGRLSQLLAEKDAYLAMVEKNAAERAALLAEKARVDALEAARAQAQNRPQNTRATDQAPAVQKVEVVNVEPVPVVVESDPDKPAARPPPFASVGTPDPEGPVEVTVVQGEDEPVPVRIHVTTEGQVSAPGDGMTTTVTAEPKPPDKPLTRLP